MDLVSINVYYSLRPVGGHPPLTKKTPSGLTKFGEGGSTLNLLR